jgi:N-acyl-D-aspartate/D-glutamate deacylase
VKDGRVAAIGKIGDTATRVIDAGGRVLAPGFVDMHTHYDAQVFWDPTLSPSCLHGVTSVFAGNCGFSIAPLSVDAAPYLRRMLARSKGCRKRASRLASRGTGRSFDDYLSRLEGRVGLNIGVMCGHSGLRRTVMGNCGQTERASEDDLARMKSVLAASLAAGAMGFSTTISNTHNDADGNPVPSRAASEEELIALCGVCRDYPGTTIELGPGIDPFSPELVELMTQMSLAARRPVNWNAIAPQPGNEGLVEQPAVGCRLCPRPRRRDPRIDRRGQRHGAAQLPHRLLPRQPAGLGIGVPPAVPERIELLRNPEKRREMEAGASSRTGGVAAMMSRFDGYTITDSGNREFVGRQLADIAAQQGKSVFDAMIDMTIADGLRTVFSPQGLTADRALWERRGEIWQDDRAMIGASDAGAHLDMIDTFHYTSYMLGVAREQQVISLEETVRQLSWRPAEFMGLVERGQLHEGWHADLVLFDRRPWANSRPTSAATSRATNGGCSARRAVSATSSATAQSSSRTARTAARCPARYCAQAATRETYWPKSIARTAEPA